MGAGGCGCGMGGERLGNISRCINTPSLCRLQRQIPDVRGHERGEAEAFQSPQSSHNKAVTSCALRRSAKGNDLRTLGLAMPFITAWRPTASVIAGRRDDERARPIRSTRPKSGGTREQCRGPAANAPVASEGVGVDGVAPRHEKPRPSPSHLPASPDPPH